MPYLGKKTSPLFTFSYTKGVGSLVSARVFGVGCGRPQVELGFRYTLDSSSPEPLYAVRSLVQAVSFPACLHLKPAHQSKGAERW